MHSDPGPQTYDASAIQKAILLQPNKKNISNIKFGTDVRECNKADKKTKLTPSPATYDPEMIRKGLKHSKKGTASVKFGKAQKNELKVSSYPGPQVRKEYDFCKSLK